MKKDIPNIKKQAREPLETELNLKNIVYDRTLQKEKDYYLKLRAICHIVKSPRMFAFYRKAEQRWKEKENLKNLDHESSSRVASAEDERKLVVYDT